MMEAKRISFKTDDVATGPWLEFLLWVPSEERPAVCARFLAWWVALNVLPTSQKDQAATLTAPAAHLIETLDPTQWLTADTVRVELARLKDNRLNIRLPAANALTEPWFGLLLQVCPSNLVHAAAGRAVVQMFIAGKALAMMPYVLQQQTLSAPAEPAPLSGPPPPPWSGAERPAGASDILEEFQIL